MKDAIGLNKTVQVWNELQVGAVTYFSVNSGLYSYGDAIVYVSIVCGALVFVTVVGVVLMSRSHA